MKLFRKNQRSVTEQNTLTRMSGAIAQRQRKLADYLDRKTQYWNESAKITALVIFCLLFGGTCLLLIIHAINH